MIWSLGQWQPKSYFQSYVHNKFFDNGELNFENVERYAPKFGLTEKDFNKVEKENQAVQLLFKKQLEKFPKKLPKYAS